jgi:hypothetical protein
MLGDIVKEGLCIVSGILGRRCLMLENTGKGCDIMPNC